LEDTLRNQIKPKSELSSLVAKQRDALDLFADLAWADRLGYRVSADLNFLNRRMRTRMSGGVARESR
jgi:hypothetical protein